MTIPCHMETNGYIHAKHLRRIDGHIMMHHIAL